VVLKGIIFGEDSVAGQMGSCWGLFETLNVVEFVPPEQESTMKE